MRVKGLQRWVVVGVLAVSSALCHAKENTKIPDVLIKSDLVRRLEAIFYSKSFADIQDRTFPAAKYGAKADGKTVNTKAIQAAIDAASKAGGGVVTLDQGVNVCGALFVKSNVELRLDEGVVLQAVHDDAEFPDKWTRIAGIEMDWPAA